MSEVTLGEVTISFDDRGTGAPAVLLVHGHPFDRSLWGPQQAALAPRHRILTPDLRGYGRSSVVPGKTTLDAFARDLRELLACCGLADAPVVVVGLSMGGQIALEFTRLFPAHVRGLVLADTFAQPDDALARQRRLQTAARLRREGMAGYAVETLPHMLAPATLAGQPDVAAHVLRMMREAPPEGAAAALCGRAERPDYRPLLPTVTVPTLIVVGREDGFTPVSDAESMHRLVPGSTLAVIESAGHLPNLEQPAEFNRLLDDFLENLREAGPDGFPAATRTERGSDPAA